MSEFETEIRQKINEHLAKYKENPNTVFLSEDMYRKIFKILTFFEQNRFSSRSNETIFGLKMIIVNHEHDFIHVTKIG